MAPIWRPIKGTHAIQVASVHVAFSQQATDLMWKRIEATAEAAAKRAGMPQRESVQSITVAITPNAPTLPPVTESGFEFQKLQPTGALSAKLTVMRDSVRLEEWAYTRWASLKSKANIALKPVLDEYIKNLPIVGIILEYVDIFQTPIGNVSEDVGEVVNANSGLISRSAFHASTPWHSHCGWFDQPLPSVRRLTQVNVDVGEAASPLGSFKAVQIRTVLNDQFNQEGMPAYSPIASFLDDTLDVLHATSKETLAKVLTADARSSISL